MKPRVVFELATKLADMRRLTSRSSWRVVGGWVAQATAERNGSAYPRFDRTLDPGAHRHSVRPVARATHRCFGVRGQYEPRHLGCYAGTPHAAEWKQIDLTLLELGMS